MSTIHVDVVSAEESIFSGEATFVALPGEAGELGIYPRHTPLITRIRPGSVRIQTADGGEEFVFVAGGILEVQPDCVTVLSDTAVRGKDLDEEKANEAKQAAEVLADPVSCLTLMRNMADPMAGNNVTPMGNPVSKTAGVGPTGNSGSSADEVFDAILFNTQGPAN